MKLNNVTIIIKTFERKNILVKLLNSIKNNYPQLPIIIVDDSKKTYKNYILKKFPNLDINYIVEEYDIGLSKGRNILINSVKTEYFLLCDDDFEFDQRTNIEYAKKTLEKYNLDILGGCVYNRISLDSMYSFLWVLKDIRRLKKVLRHEEFISIYNGKYSIEKNNKIRLLIDKNSSHYQEKDAYNTEICSNFFLAKTESIKKIGGWTPELLKVGEHEFFFLKAKKKKLKIMYSSFFGVRHYPKKTFNYMKFRMKAEKYFKEACRLENISYFEVYDQYSKKIIYKYDVESDKYERTN